MSRHKYRCRHEIQAIIIECLMKGPASQTRVMNASFLNHVQLKRALAPLIENGFVLMEGDYTLSASKLGVAWLDHFRKLEAFSG